MGTGGPLSAWWRSLAGPPELLTPSQRRAFFWSAIAVALTRLLAIAKTPWDWDEMLFMLAVRDFNVAAHHPHPPGFPLFIGLAKLVHLRTEDEFRALQAIVVAGAMLVFPAAFFLARELRFSFATSFTSALLLAMFPNVLFYGGTALSDVPSMTLVMLACALLLRGCRSSGAYVTGAIVLALAAGFRPQNLLVGCAPALIATAWRWRTNRRAVFAAIAIGMAIAAASYGVAIAETGWPSYRAALRVHQQYIETTDSFLSPSRTPLRRLLDDFFVRPWRQGFLNAVVLLFVVSSLLRGIVTRRGPVLAALAAFGPFCLFAWLFLDVHSASRFSLGYIPLFALLAADGLEFITRRFAIACGALLAAAMFLWALPALDEVRRIESPTYSAVGWVQALGDAESTIVYADPPMRPFFEALAPAYAVMETGLARVPVPWTEHRDAFLVREGPGETPFVRPHGRLWDIARRRYFVTSVTPLRERITFGEGWHAQEGRAPLATRWMAGRSVMTLPAIGANGQLAISLYVPDEVRGAHVRVLVDGAVVDQLLAPDGYLDRTYRLDGTRPTEVTIEIDRTLDAPGDDPRRLGLRLESLEWSKPTA